MRRTATSHRQPARSAMTLLEVILSLAILCGSLAVLGELVRVGTRACRKARMLSTAQLLAESLAADFTAQAATSPEPTEGMIEQFGGTAWAYRVDVQPAPQQGLLAITVTVSENVDPSQQPIGYSLLQWLVDPQVESDLQTVAAELEAAATPVSGTSSNSSAGANEPAGGSR